MLPQFVCLLEVSCQGRLRVGSQAARVSSPVALEEDVRGGRRGILWQGGGQRGSGGKGRLEEAREMADGIEEEGKETGGGE